MRAIVVVVACLMVNVARAEVGVGWSGALHVGGGATLVGDRPTPHGVELGLRLHILVGADDRGGIPDHSWSAGPFFDLHTLGFGRADVVVGLHVSTPRLGHTRAALRLDVGGGYSYGSGANADAPELVVTLFGGFRAPLAGSMLMPLGIYVETRVFFADARAVTLTGGLEVDPVGLLVALLTIP